MPREQLTQSYITEEWNEPDPKDDLPAGKRIRKWTGGVILEGHTLHEDPRLHIHWDPNSGVQFSLEIELHQIEERLAELEKEGGVPPYSVSFYTPCVSRDEVQKVIRQTKRARNSVFGADE